MASKLLDVSQKGQSQVLKTICANKQLVSRQLVAHSRMGSDHGGSHGFTNVHDSLQ